jgi:hypothetical protein
LAEPEVIAIDYSHAKVTNTSRQNRHTDDKVVVTLPLGIVNKLRLKKACKRRCVSDLSAIEPFAHSVSVNSNDSPKSHGRIFG